jgi:hypothetical protein
MRFMMMVIPEGYESAAPDAVPLATSVADVFRRARFGVMLRASQRRPR